MRRPCAAISRNSSSDPRVIENQGLALAADPQRHHPADPARASRRATIARSGTPSRTNPRSRPSPARRPRSLAQRLSRSARDVMVDWAMRYGNPSIASRLRSRWSRRLRAHPGDAALSAIFGRHHGDRLRRGVPRARADAPAAGAADRRALLRRSGLYRGARASRPRPSLPRLPFEPEVILASFHGMPQDYIAKGDPYYRPLRRDHAAPARAARLDESQLMLTFQSRFGRAKWLEPFTDQDGQDAGQAGREESIAVVTPGFSADCLETLEEIAVENAHVFTQLRRAKFRGHSRASTTATPGMLVLAADGAARVERLGVTDGKAYDNDDAVGRCESSAQSTGVIVALATSAAMRRVAGP